MGSGTLAVILVFIKFFAEQISKFIFPFLFLSLVDICADILKENKS